MLKNTETHEQIQTMANHGPLCKWIKSDKENILKSTMWKRQKIYNWCISIQTHSALAMQRFVSHSPCRETAQDLLCSPTKCYFALYCCIANRHLAPALCKAPLVTPSEVESSSWQVRDLWHQNNHSFLQK